MSTDVVFLLFNIYLSYLFNLDELPFSKGCTKGRPHNFVDSYKIYKLSYFVDVVASNLWMGPNKALLTAQWPMLRAGCAFDH
jgi:hypothetical protein